MQILVTLIRGQQRGRWWDCLICCSSRHVFFFLCGGGGRRAGVVAALQLPARRACWRAQARLQHPPPRQCCLWTTSRPAQPERQGNREHSGAQPAHITPGMCKVGGHRPTGDSPNIRARHDLLAAARDAQARGEIKPEAEQAGTCARKKGGGTAAEPMAAVTGSVAWTRFWLCCLPWRRWLPYSLGWWMSWGGGG